MSTVVNEVTPFAQYEASAGADTFQYTWWIREETDLKVYVDGELVATTDYTVSGVQTSTGGNVVFDTPLTGGEIVTISTDYPFERLTGFATSGSLRAAALNLELSYLVACILQLQRDIQRTLKLSPSSQIDTTALVLPEPEDQRILYWNGTEGVIANSAFNIDVLEGNAADIAANLTAINALYTQLAAILNVSANLGTGLPVTVVAANTTSLTTVATNIANVNLVGGSIANVNSVAGGLTNINTVAGAIANVNTVAGISANVTSVAGIAADVTAVAGNATNIDAVAGNATNINAVAGNATNINAVAGNATNINAVAADATDIGTVASNIANVNTVAGISANVTSVAGIASDVTTVAANIVDVQNAEENAAAAAASAAKLTGTSTSSVAIGTGSKSFTTQASKFFDVGNWLMITDDAAPSTNWMHGQVTDYNSGTGALTVLVSSTGGSGTKTAWTIRVSGAQGAPGTVADGDKGDITVSTSGSVWTVDNDAITYAKMQNVSATSRILGRRSAGAGDPEECTLSQILDFIGSAAEGDILYRGASTWTRLAKGTALQNLRMNSGATAPEWATVSGLTFLTQQNSTSGTSIDFSVPTTASRITVMLRGVSTNGTSHLMVQIGTGGSPTTSGYQNASTDFNGTGQGGSYNNSGFHLNASQNSATNLVKGVMTLERFGTSDHYWLCHGLFNIKGSAQSGFVSGSLLLGGALDMVRVTTQGGTAAFDAGVINVKWE